MSGGFFEYQQYHLGLMADEIQEIIDTNGKENGNGMCYNYSDATMEEFKSAVLLFRKAYIYAHRIDWLVSGDDGEEEFHVRLQQELNELNQ